MKQPHAHRNVKHSPHTRSRWHTPADFTGSCCFAQTLLYKCPNRLNTYLLFTGNYLTAQFQFDLCGSEQSPEPPPTPSRGLFPPSTSHSLPLLLSADSWNYDLFPVHRNNRIQEEEGGRQQLCGTVVRSPATLWLHSVCMCVCVCKCVYIQMC